MARILKKSYKFKVGCVTYTIPIELKPVTIPKRYRLLGFDQLKVAGYYDHVAAEIGNAQWSPEEENGNYYTVTFGECLSILRVLSLLKTWGFTAAGLMPLLALAAKHPKEPCGGVFTVPLKALGSRIGTGFPQIDLLDIRGDNRRWLYLHDHRDLCPANSVFLIRRLPKPKG